MFYVPPAPCHIRDIYTVPSITPRTGLSITGFSEARCWIVPRHPHPYVLSRDTKACANNPPIFIARVVG
jgi:hypothetical protein